MGNARLDEFKQESRQAGETSATSDVWVIPLQWQRARGTKESC